MLAPKPCVPERRPFFTVGRPFLSLKGGTLSACPSLLACIEKELPLTRLRVEFSKGDLSFQLNRLFTSDGVHGMLGERVPIHQ